MTYIRSRGTKSKFSRWNKNKRSIPNNRVRPFRFFFYPIAVAVKPGASLEVSCLTDIPSASRSLNNVLIKSFDIDLRFMPVDGCFRPTWVRFAIVVQTGPYILPNAAELIAGVSHLDIYIDMSSSREGWQNRTYALNSQYKVIFLPQAEGVIGHGIGGKHIPTKMARLAKGQTLG